MSEEVVHLIPLTQGRHAIVDGEDWERLRKHNWCFNGRYACRNPTVACGKQRTLMMHRDILGLGDDDPRHTDHINHNTLDNRRGNLRAVTNRQNAENRTDQSQYGVGVERLSHHHHGKPYRAKAWVDGKTRHIGVFATPEEAREARRKFIEGLE